MCCGFTIDPLSHHISFAQLKFVLEEEDCNPYLKPEVVCHPWNLLSL